MPGGAYSHSVFTVSEQSTCYYQIDLYLDACLECAAGSDRGWYQPRCEDCPVNRYKDAAGRVATFQSQDPCTACQAGKDTRGNLGSSSCTACAAGMYAGTPGDTCVLCPAGSETRLSNAFHSGDGATACEACATGQYSAESTTQCSTCDVDEVTGDSNGDVVTGTGATVCLAKATCGDADGEGAGTAPVDSEDCGTGLAYDTSASAATCASTVCDLVGTAADRTACCAPVATCGDADGAGAGSTAVSDCDCGDGYMVRPATESIECQSTSCDIAGTTADKAACCVVKATCGDADGEGAGTAPVDSADCGTGLLYDTSASAATCASTVCDLVGTAADRTACCTESSVVDDPAPGLSGGIVVLAVVAGFVAGLATAAGVWCKLKGATGGTAVTEQPLSKQPVP